MTSPDYPDFTQGVGILDQAATLTTANQTITANGSQVTVDTSKLASLTIIIQLPNGAAGLRYRLTVQWVDAGFSQVQKQITYHSANSYASNPAILQWQVPCLGTSANLVLRGDSNAVCNLIVIGSTRVVPGETIAYNQGDDDQMLLNVPSQSIPAAGASTTLYVPPVARAYHLYFVCSVAGCNYAMTGVNREAAGSTARGVMTLATTTNRQIINNFVLPRTALEVVMNNPTAGAVSMGFVAWDAS